MQVTELTPEYTESETGSGYGKVVRNVVIGMKTVKGAKQLRLDPTIYDTITKEKVQVGECLSVGCNLCYYYLEIKDLSWILLLLLSRNKGS